MNWRLVLVFGFHKFQGPPLQGKSMKCFFCDMELSHERINVLNGVNSNNSTWLFQELKIEKFI